MDPERDQLYEVLDMDFNKVKNEVHENIEKFVQIRRNIHKNPELSMEEYETTDYIVKTLKEFGLKEVEKINSTGVVAIIRGNGLKCIAVRADIDALPIEENNNLDFKSTNKGVMHACGHDVHTTSLLGCAYILNKFKDDLNGIVKLIFQPGEETGKGAKYMIENGVLSNEPVPEAIFGLHCWPAMEAGKIYHRHGKMGACSDTFDIKIKGKSGHAAHPENAVDPIMILGNLICSIQNIISRELNALEQGIITISSVHGGQASNTIPDEVLIKGAIRALSEETREFLHRRLREITDNVCKTFGGNSEIKINKGIPVSYNDEQVSKVIEDSIIKNLGEDSYIYNPNPSMGSEDFAYYGKIIPGAMYRIGTGFRDQKNPPLHSSGLLINEDAIETGILSMAAVCDDLLNSL